MEAGPARGPKSYQATLRGQSEQEFICDLKRATPGSAGLDLYASSYIVLTPEMGPQALSTGIFGPLKEGVLGLILGRSSSAMKGLQVFPRVIDQDYKGKLKLWPLLLKT